MIPEMSLEMRAMLDDPTPPAWVKEALRGAAAVDPMDAAHYAEWLARVLGAWADNHIETLLADANAEAHPEAVETLVISLEIAEHETDAFFFA